MNKLPCGKYKCKKNKCSFETFYIHGWHRSKKWDFNHHLIPPISSSITYRLESAKRGHEGFEEFAEGQQYSPIYIYDRLGEPVRSILEENLSHCERGEIGVAFSSGMAAISSCLLAFLKPRDEIISHKIIYGCTHSLLSNWMPRFGIKVQFLDLTDLERLRKHINRNTRIIYFETPSNPTLQLIDIEAISKMIHKIRKDIFIVVDNTFATPFCQRPIELGADFVIHSLSKNIGGFGTDLGGIIITRREFWRDLLLVRKDFGSVLSPKNAWNILVYGLTSLPTRLKRQQETALKVAQFLENHKKIKKVLYPGLDSFPQKEIAKKQMRSPDGNFAPGFLIYFLLKGSIIHTKKFLDKIAKNAYSIALAVSLGQVKTLIESPVLMTHATLDAKSKAEMGLSSNGIRISIGLENPSDIINDLNNALS